MHRGQIGDLISFVAIAEELSFKRAAVRLGVTPSALSHTIRQLEERLGARLLNRTTRSVALSNAGRQLIEQVQPAISQIEAAVDSLNLTGRKPSGKLRIYASYLASISVVVAVWQQYLATFPDVQLDVEVGETSIDFVEAGFDAAIWSHNRIARDMVAVRVSDPMKVAIVASKSFLDQRPAPRNPEDLLHYDCVQYRRGGDRTPVPWLFERMGEQRKVRIHGPVTVTTPELTLRAALDGLGIAYLFEGYAEPYLKSGKLVRVLEDWSPLTEGLFLCYPGQRQVPASLRAFIDLLATNRRNVRGTTLKRQLKVGS
jgi:DNA-binding transcriptional LysR family regulator